MCTPRAATAFLNCSSGEKFIFAPSGIWRVACGRWRARPLRRCAEVLQLPSGEERRMKTGSLSRRRLTLLGGLAAAALAALVTVGVAYGTGPFGTAAPTRLGGGTSVHTSNARVGPTKLQTK